MESRQLFSDRAPFPLGSECRYDAKPLLPCSWIAAPRSSGNEPEVTLFQLDVMMECDDTFTIHVSADQQYMLYIDGQYVGRGCEMKSPQDWFFESYEVSLERGAHRVSALVWHYGDLSPMNRMTVSPGLFLMPDEERVPLLGTGVAPWKVCTRPGVAFTRLVIVPYGWMSVPPHQTVDCIAFFRERHENDWHAPQVVEQGRNGQISVENGVHLLKPGMTELMLAAPSLPGKAVFISDVKDDNGYVPEVCDDDALAHFNSMRNSASMRVPKNTAKRVILDLEDYFCAYTSIGVKGGRNGSVRITWAEAAFTDPEKPVKGRRDTVAGTYFRGLWDEFILDGEARELSPLSWRCGRFIELYIVAAEDAVELESFTLRETRYPLDMDGGFSCDAETVNMIVPFCFRTLQMSAHDNFMDCPFYEQLLYAGDGRIESLVALATCHDDTLARKAITTLASSRDMTGCTMARWPSTFQQYIPSFSLWWIGMIHDYALWRNDQAFIASLMPGVRFLLDHFLGRLDGDGFLRGVEWEWNFIDWVDEWNQGDEAGIPPGMNEGVSASYNWLLVYALTMVCRLEKYAGDRFLAERWGRQANELSRALTCRFWDPARGLCREDDSGKYFSEHAQSLSILSGCLEAEQLEKLKVSLPSTDGLARGSIFYKHYLFESFGALGLPDKILSELNLWNDFLDKGFKTVPETPENRTFNQRSDCHGWGAHPIYHLIATIAGIKPAEMGFRSVHINPQLGSLRKVNAVCACPGGTVSAGFIGETSTIHAEVCLPEGMSGTWRIANAAGTLRPGEQRFSVEVDRAEGVE